MTRTMTGTVLLGLLAACPAKDDTTTPTDSGTPTTSPPPTTTSPPPTTPFDDFPEADLTDPDVIVGLASASAPKLFLLHYAMILDAENNSDKVCPAVTEVKDSTTIVGDCTDSDGVEWFGSVQLDVDKKGGTASATFAGFGSTIAVPCTKTGEVLNERLFDGTLTLGTDVSTMVYATSGTFTTVDPDACTGEVRHFLLDYSGANSPYTGAWAGAGTYADDIYGRAAVETVNEILDETACYTEAMTGVTTFVTSTDVAAILYDGAFDCDLESTAIWLLNGSSQGELAGIGCASTSTQGAGFLGIAALIALGRRRRQA